MKNIKTVRIDPTNYTRIKNHIMEILKTNGFVISDIREVPNKDSYGDLDLLWWKEDMNSFDIRKIIEKLFHPNEMVSNGEVLSWDFENFQIDLIKCSSLQQMEFAKFYFSYGDLGAILGRFCNYHGLKIGHRGFWIDVYESTIYPEKPMDPTRNIGEIYLSLKPEEACQYLGLNYQKWVDGFVDLKSIFDWIISSKYFVQKIFAELNSDHMKRAKMRPMYMKFIEYIGLNPLAVNGKPDIRFNMQSDAIEYFSKKQEVIKIREQLEFNSTVKNKFSGKKLIEMGFSGKEIGQILKSLEKFVENNFNQKLDLWIYQTDIEIIDQTVKQIISQYSMTIQTV